MAVNSSLRGLRLPRLNAPPTALSPGGGVEPANPNLLLWSEQLQQDAWIKTNAVVMPNAALAPNGTMTADSVAFVAGGSLRQVTSIAATGSAVTGFRDASADRVSLTGAFDGITYVFSFWPLGDGAIVRLRLDVSGGFLRVSVEDIGELAVFNPWGFQLETSTMTDYVKREGA